MALKTKAVRVESLGEDILVRELSARAQIEIIEAAEKSFEGVFIAVHYGVPDWADRSIDDLKDQLTLSQATEIAGHVFTLSGVADEKN